MDDEILIKSTGKNPKAELRKIGFSQGYTDNAKDKYKTLSFKIFNLKAPEANILKQTCLSLGFDCAVSEHAVNCKCEKTDALTSGTKEQFKRAAEKLSKQPYRLNQLSKLITEFINETTQFKIADRNFDYADRLIAGILNVTPDSFSDGGKYFTPESALERAFEIIEHGADIIDIGGESTRPGATPVDSETELKRILPVVRKIRESNKSVLISIDTMHAETAKECIKAGANILNSVCDIKNFESIFDIIKSKNISVVVMHSENTCAEHTDENNNKDIVDNIFKYFCDRTQYLREQRLTDNTVIFDPGIGFGKSAEECYELIKRSGEFLNNRNPILYGISRKSFITKYFEDREEAGKIYHAYLMSQGVQILRVHDVKAAVELRNYLDKIR